MIKMELKGFGETRRILEKMPVNVQKKALGKGVQKAALLLAREARKRAPRRKGRRILSTTKGINQAVSRRGVGGSGVLLAGGSAKTAVTRKVGWTKGRDAGNHGHLVEFGHDIYRPRKSFAIGGRIRTPKGVEWVRTGKRTEPKPHLQPAFAANDNAMITLMQNEVEKYLFGEFQAQLKALKLI